MPTVQVTHNPAVKRVIVQDLNDNLYPGYTKIGEILHMEIDDPLDLNNSEVDHNDQAVIYHYVRDMMYKLGIYNMAEVQIISDAAIIEVTAISVTPAAAPLAPLASVQLVTAFTPANATIKKLTYVSDNPAFASVNGAGLVVAHAVGVATITVTSADGNFTDTSVITVA